MPDFFTVLALYYLCEAAALTRDLSTEERWMCFNTYENVKSHFIDEDAPAPSDTAERAEQLRDAYTAFRAWEEANPEIVQDMREEARAAAEAL